MPLTLWHLLQERRFARRDAMEGWDVMEGCDTTYGNGQGLNFQHAEQSFPFTPYNPWRSSKTIWMPILLGSSELSSLPCPSAGGLVMSITAPKKL